MNSNSGNRFGRFPGEQTNKVNRVTFQFDGLVVDSYAGESVAAALIAVATWYVMSQRAPVDRRAPLLRREFFKSVQRFLKPATSDSPGPGKYTPRHTLTDGRTEIPPAP